VRRGEYDIARRGYTGEYADPHSLVSLFTTGNGMNTTNWGSAEFDRLVAASDREPDRAKRFALLAQAERLLLDEAPMFPIFHYVGHNWLKPFVKGVHPNPRDMHPLQGVTLEGAGAPKDGVLIFNAAEEPHALDPALSDDIGGLKILMHLFEGLANYDPMDASPVPAAAESWELSADGTTYTFRLRPATWSNGDPLTASDFVYAWRRVVDPKTPSSYKDRMYLVKNAKEIVEGKVPPESLGVRAPDDRTFVVELNQPAPYFPQLICLNIFFPVHRATVEAYGDKWTRPEHMVGNGPYRMTTWKINDRKEFEKNPRYRAAAKVKLERFTFLTPGPDTATGLRMYQAGQVHWIFQAPTELMDELSKSPDHIHGKTNQCYFYVFNVKVKPLDDVRVRRALSLVVDRKMICEKVLRGGETPADRLTPMLYPDYVVK
jgi:oligopeptide transport system substrate-binding protein